MSLRATVWAWSVTAGSPTAKLVLFALAEHADEVGLCWPSIARLHRHTELSERAIRNALRDLETAGLIVTETRDGQPSRYRLTVSGGVPPRHETPGSEQNTPAPDAGEGGTSCRGGRHVVPGTPARGAPKPIKEPISEPSVNHKRRAAPIVALPEWLPQDAWAEWCRHKGAKWGRGVGPAKAINALSRYRDEGHDPRDVIDHSLAAGWAGLFPPRRANAPAERPGKLDWIDNDPLFRRTA